MFIFKWSSSEDKLKYMIRFGVVNGKEKRENQVKPGKFKTFKDFHIDLGIDLATKAESSPGKHVASFVRPHRISEEKRRLSSEEISSRHKKNNNNNSNVVRRATVKVESEAKKFVPGRNFTPIMIDFPFRRLGIQFSNGTITGATRSALALGVCIGDRVWKINNVDIHKDAVITPEVQSMDIDRRVLYISSKCMTRPLRIHFWRPKKKNKSITNLRANRRCTSMQICAQAIADMRIKSLERTDSEKHIASSSNAVLAKRNPLWHALPCVKCCSSHNRYSRSCIDCGENYCRACKKVHMKKQGKKRWLCNTCIKVEEKVQKRIEGVPKDLRHSQKDSYPSLPTFLPTSDRPSSGGKKMTKKNVAAVIVPRGQSADSFQKELFAVLQKRKKSN